MTTCAFLGVGAPEAVLVGVVALIVFGPKGLAEVRILVHDWEAPVNSTLFLSKFMQRASQLVLA